MAADFTEGTLAPGTPESEGLPQLNAESYASQLFWLLITFVFLYIVVSRLAVPRIGGAIEARRGRIEDDLQQAEDFRRGAADALQAYEAALAEARGRASALADENRKRIASEVEMARAAADAKAHDAMAAAEKRIAVTRTSATANVASAAAEAAADIVERLIGERIAAAEAAKAVKN